MSKPRPQFQVGDRVRVDWKNPHKPYPYGGYLRAEGWVQEIQLLNGAIIVYVILLDHTTVDSDRPEDSEVGTKGLFEEQDVYPINRGASKREDHPNP